jgi:hypothetical protein
MRIDISVVLITVGLCWAAPAQIPLHFSAASMLCVSCFGPVISEGAVSRTTPKTSREISSHYRFASGPVLPDPGIRIFGLPQK